MARDDAYDLYRGDVSYFSGKLEAYLQYKRIPFRRIEARTRVMQRVLIPNAGIAKMPMLRAPDGTWLQDTTPIIDWLEARHPDGAVIPPDPGTAFLTRLLEDYADEWLWRPALHYRWSYEPDASLLAGRIAREIVDMPGVPRALVARFVKARQRRLYVRGDGVDRHTRAHVEGIYLDTLRRLDEVLASRRFLLCDRPSLADFGFMGPMFRHFALDPTPARIMRDLAPRVFAWVARLWAVRHDEVKSDWPVAGGVPDAWGPVLDDAATGYLPYLHQNALAFGEGRRRFDWQVQGVRYRGTPVVVYRVWCRERLQRHFEALPPAAKERVRETLEAHGAFAPLWRDGVIASRLHVGADPPVCRRPDPARARRLRRAGSTGWNLPDARWPGG